MIPRSRTVPTISAIATAIVLGMLPVPAMAQEVDLSNPDNIKAYRDGFRTGVHKRCMADVEQRAAAEGKSFGERQRGVADAFCTCSVDGISALVADDQVESLKTVMTDPALKPQRQQIFADCATSAEQSTN
jgi:hypothetical protein